MAMIGARISAMAPFGRLRRGEFRMLLHDAFDILDHHDGVVDHDADASTMASNDTVLAE